MIRRWSVLFLVASLILVANIASAQPSDAQQEQIASAFKEAQKVQQVGPAEITLLDQAMLRLPPKYIYVPQPQAGKLMQSIGNRDNPSLVGLVWPENQDENWMVVIKYEKSGYVKDDDAKSWNVDELFTSIKEGTEETNKERKEKGFPELEIIGWVEKPQYDSTRKHLVWSISAQRKGDNASGSGRQTINYNTYALGREGYLTLNLVTKLKDVEAQKPVATELLAATEFLPGKRYEDFNSSTDKIAEYGLAALVAGAAAKKLGFFAIIAGFVLKFAKIIGLAIVAGGGILAKLFRRKKKEVPTSEAPPEP